MNALTLLDSDTAEPAGMALVSGEGLNGGRVYMCDPANHLIEVVDDAAHPLFSFGGFGSGAGKFNTPIDLAIVPLGGDYALTPVTGAVLAVADRGNHRLQLFTLDGLWLATVDNEATPPRSGWRARTGWPYFRLGISPCVRLPSRLRWRAPYLDVISVVGNVARVDLAVALLPDFAEWLRTASRKELRKAFRAFAGDPAGHRVPEHCLHRISRRLDGAGRASAMAVVPR